MIQSIIWSIIEIIIIYCLPNCYYFQVNNDNDSSIKTIEVDSDSDNSNSCEIIDDHQETTGIEVKLIYLFLKSTD